MASHEKASLSLLDKIKLAGQIGLIVLETCFKFAAGLFQAEKLQPWKKRAICQLMGSHRVTNLPHRYLRALLPTTGETIRAFCKAQSFVHDETVIQVGEKYPNATLHFIDVSRSSPEPRTTMLYLHGGGYHNPSTQGPLLLSTSCAKHAGMRLVMLEYSLAPEAKYPTQLVQAVAALRYLLADREPKNIVLAGDSAGAHLVLSVLAHCTSSSPYAPQLALGDGVDSKLRGALLVSPWVNTDYSAATFDKNSSFDFLHREQMQIFNKFWQPKEEEVWANPRAEGSEFWSQAPVNKIMLTTGTWEVFYDDALAMATILGDTKDKEDFTLYIASRDIHVGILMELGLQLPESEAKRCVLSWIAAL